MKYLIATTTLALTAILSGCGGGGASVNNSTSYQELAKPTGSSKPTKLGFAEWVEGVYFKVKEVETNTDIQNQPYMSKLSKDETFVIVHYQMTNNAGSALSGSDLPRIVLRDSGGRAFYEDMAAGVTAVRQDEQQSGGILNPDMSISSAVAWRVKQAAFDKGTWTVSVGSETPVAFALK